MTVPMSARSAPVTQLGPPYLRQQADRFQRLSRNCMDLHDGERPAAHGRGIFRRGHGDRGKYRNGRCIPTQQLSSETSLSACESLPRDRCLRSDGTVFSAEAGRHIGHLARTAAALATGRRRGGINSALLKRSET